MDIPNFCKQTRKTCFHNNQAFRVESVSSSVRTHFDADENKDAVEILCQKAGPKNHAQTQDKVPKADVYWDRQREIQNTGRDPENQVSRVKAQGKIHKQSRQAGVKNRNQIQKKKTETECHKDNRQRRLEQGERKNGVGTYTELDKTN